MAYFTLEYTDFFKELEEHNNKTWFHDNKKRYENHVRKPMIALVGDLGDAMKKHDSDFNIIPSKCLGRINRDIRFSKDKTPYNQHFFAHITKGPKEDQRPGIAFRFGAHDAGIMGGYFNCDKERLRSIKEAISHDLPKFQQLINDPEFKNKFGVVRGEVYKRIPKELQDIYNKEPLIANKQYYYVAEKGADFVTSANLLEEILDHWLAAKNLNEFIS